MSLVHATSPVALCLCALWQLHYLNRTFVYPFRTPNRGKQVPISIPAIAVAFNCVNAYLNARWISHLAAYPLTWLARWIEDYGDIYTVIKRGVPSTMMAGYDAAIPDADIRSILNYLRTLAPKK